MRRASVPVRMRNLDALRIIAAAAVVVMHYADYASDLPGGKQIAARLWHFNLFVDLFFVISGFTIGAKYLDRVDTVRDTARFLWRRMARIYPLHLLTLVGYAAIAVGMHAQLISVNNPDRYPLSDLPAQFLLLHAVAGAHLTFNFPSWSISAELFCYLAFPVVAWTSARWPVSALWIAGAVAAANSAWAVVVGAPFWSDWINQGGVFRALPAFHLGVALCVGRASMVGWWIPRGASTLALMGFLVAGSQFAPPLALALAYLIGILAVHADVTEAPTALTKSGCDRWTDLTYSLYMLHMPVATVCITLVGRVFAPSLPGGRAVLIVVAIPVLVASSVASLRWFERPLRRALNAAFDRWTTGSASRPVAAREGSRR